MELVSWVIIAIAGDKKMVSVSAVTQIREQRMFTIADFVMAEPTEFNMNKPEHRLNVLKQMDNPFGRSLTLVQNIHFKEEADYIRDKGGFVWHVKGSISDKIPFDRSDLLVTTKLMAEGAYYPVNEVLHECRLKGRANKSLPKPSVVWRK